MFQFRYLHHNHKVVQGRSAGVGDCGHKTEEEKEASAVMITL